ncbi:hypothetical protein NQZ79_g7706 [Umbelopsis isabellina]|nr:hypothetical protein NQZ79_g7706 [Umbelopsis isabellina]
MNSKHKRTSGDRAPGAMLTKMRLLGSYITNAIRATANMMYNKLNIMMITMLLRISNHPVTRYLRAANEEVYWNKARFGTPRRMKRSKVSREFELFDIIYDDVAMAGSLTKSLLCALYTTGLLCILHVLDREIAHGRDPFILLVIRIIEESIYEDNKLKLQLTGIEMLMYSRLFNTCDTIFEANTRLKQAWWTLKKWHLIEWDSCFGDGMPYRYIHMASKKRRISVLSLDGVSLYNLISLIKIGSKKGTEKECTYQRLMEENILACQKFASEIKRFTGRNVIKGLHSAKPREALVKVNNGSRSSIFKLFVLCKRKASERLAYLRDGFERTHDETTITENSLKSVVPRGSDFASMLTVETQKRLMICNQEVFRLIPQDDFNDEYLRQRSWILLTVTYTILILPSAMALIPFIHDRSVYASVNVDLTSLLTYTAFMSALAIAFLKSMVPGDWNYKQLLLGHSPIEKIDWSNFFKLAFDPLTFIKYHYLNNKDTIMERFNIGNLSALELTQRTGKTKFNLPFNLHTLFGFWMIPLRHKNGSTQIVKIQMKGFPARGTGSLKYDVFHAEEVATWICQVTSDREDLKTGNGIMCGGTEFQ